MRMQEMVEYLENQGFETTKEYDSKKKHYIFTITKDAKSLRSYFVYPDDAHRDELESIQRHFLNKMIINFKGEVNVVRHVELETGIKKVIFNPPATIVLWEDGTKTVVKAQNDDEFDSEKGLAMAISKKALGNKGNYCNEIKKWTEPYEAEVSEIEAFLEWLTKPVGPTPIELAYDALQSIQYPKTTKPIMKQKIDLAIKYLKEALED